MFKTQKFAGILAGAAATVGLVFGVGAADAAPENRCAFETPTGPAPCPPSIVSNYGVPNGPDGEPGPWEPEQPEEKEKLTWTAPEKEEGEPAEETPAEETPGEDSESPVE
ncbi:hypothetical protein SEA_JUMBO_60 [Gordonia phage Jumbo]|uniref:Uncharacterized protein n=1 Tax=Gordonia phage Jumbo TaxID=1887650 RepID=A0A1B3B0V3_9CAUD|nr:hypothetical protein BIZ69_gp060 [Gordonia phage Jumbo]AOE44568.1 hypothetical protein SEA_JUMBO_60 [Gordonia phage Jumbo]